MRSSLNLCGVYSIRSPSGKFYIGSARLVRRRWHQHKIELRAGRHKNLRLQHAWAKYGEAQMVFCLLIVCRESDRIFYEQRMFDAMRPAYNISTVAGGGSSWTAAQRQAASIRQCGKKQSAATIAARSAALMGRAVSAETKAKLAAQKGWKHSEESKAKMRGRQRTATQIDAVRRAAIGNKNCLGRIVLPAERSAISAKLKGCKRSPEAIAKHRATCAAKRAAKALST